MDIGAAAAWVAAGAAMVALYFTGVSAAAAKAQTELQRAIHRESQSPYVWADIRPDDQHGQMFLLVVGNSGPTIARNIKVVVDPPFRGADGGRYWQEAQERLAGGIASLPPGRVMTWGLGVAFRVLEDESRPDSRISIDADGPFGPLPTLEYIVRADDVRHSRSTPPGTLHGVTQAVEKVAKSVEGARRQTAVLIETLQDSWASEEPLPAEVQPVGEDQCDEQS